MARVPTLFARLVLVQVITSLALLGLFALVFYVERNRTVAQLMAERWLPDLRAHLACRAMAGKGEREGGCAGPVREVAQLPGSVFHTRAWAPRIATLLDTLREGGVPAASVAVSIREEPPLIWLALPGPAGTRWLGVPDQLVEPRLPLRMVAMLTVALGLLLLVNWRLARTLSRPLERLRQRIDDPSRAVPAAPAGTVEIATIEAAWEAAQTRLAEQARERSLLLAGVSHDLRSPLARIRMAAELLPDGDPTLAARRDTITRNVSVADQLLQSFLDHVRAGELPLDEQVDLAEHARAVVRAMGRSAVELRVEAPAHLWLAPANGVLIDRVFANLLDNAFQHGRAPVTLRLYRAVDAPATACLEVIDTGPGIPPAQQAEALRAFGRGDTSRQRPGTGLGLAVVRQVVERLGGEIRFERADGQHTVQLRLPLRPTAGG